MSMNSSAAHRQDHRQRHALSFGVDLGGTKTEVVVLSDTGETLFRERRPTPAHNYGAILDNIVELVNLAQSRVGTAQAVGVGAPGTPIPATGLLKNANTTCLIGQPLQADLSNRLQLPVRVDNDANCFTLSEAVDGAGRGAQSVFGVILGTGVGGGLYLSGGVIQGLHHIAGEWGHNPLPRRVTTDENTDLLAWGRACYCGLTDCIETYLSGPGLSRTYLEISGYPEDPEGIPTVQQICERARGQGPVAGQALQIRQAQQTLDLYTSQLAGALATVINLLDPEVIVLGGGVSNVQGLCEGVHQSLAQHVFNNQVDTRIVTAKHGDSSGVRGAAWLSQQA